MHVSSSFTFSRPVSRSTVSTNVVDCLPGLVYHEGVSKSLCDKQVTTCHGDMPSKLESSRSDGVSDFLQGPVEYCVGNMLVPSYIENHPQHAWGGTS